MLELWRVLQLPLIQLTSKLLHFMLHAKLRSTSDITYA